MDNIQMTGETTAHAGASTCALLNLVHPSPVAQIQKPQTRSATAKKLSYQQQYNQAIALSSAELGAAINGPTKRIAEHVGHAIALEEEAKIERDQAQAEFCENIGYYYEAKQRLLNPGYRKDADSGKERTPEENQRNFGASDWATFNANCHAYSLQHADRLIRKFANANGLIADNGVNIDDPETQEVELAMPSRGSTNDITAQKRYEHIATAAMEIASRNPEGEIEKLILTAAEYVPAPLMPLPPDIYTDVLSFVAMIATAVPDEKVKGEAKKLRGKLLLFRPAPDPVKTLAEATAEGKRKRDRRLTKKNGRPLGTSEHVQRLGLSPRADPEVLVNVISGPEPGRESPATVPSTEVSRTRRRLNLGDVHAVTVPIDTQGPEVVKENPPLRNEGGTLSAENLVEDNSPVPLQGSAGQHAKATYPQLVPGKKYQVRPAPSGGFGIYEGRSNVALQLFAEEDDAREVIDQLKESALVA
jgi:hypothetical protein